MMNQPRVVLVGNSLLMDGIAISLAENQMLGFERTEMECGDLQERLEALEPDLVVFELDHPLALAVRSLLSAKSELLLIGLDEESGHAVVLNSRRQQTRAMADLCRLVEEEVYPALLSAKKQKGYCSRGP